MIHTYLLALGSNMRVTGIGSPRNVLAAALEELERKGIEPLAVARTIESDPIGPSLRRYANSAVVVETKHAPLDCLAVLQEIERRFGRSRTQRLGQRWRSRALDIDIVLWSGGVWCEPDLTIPHLEMRRRDFVLGPVAAIAGQWRDPVTGLTLAQLKMRLRLHKGA
ncbi:MAG: 2-amino-4-hydroxy-6-hydroxymethyldihydropteridine diphosphokinase [Pseudomonadota bacterium]